MKKSQNTGSHIDFNTISSEKSKNTGSHVDSNTMASKTMMRDAVEVSIYVGTVL